MDITVYETVEEREPARQEGSEPDNSKEAEKMAEHTKSEKGTQKVEKMAEKTDKVAEEADEAEKAKKEG